MEKGCGVWFDGWDEVLVNTLNITQQYKLGLYVNYQLNQFKQINKWRKLSLVLMKPLGILTSCLDLLLLQQFCHVPLNQARTISTILHQSLHSQIFQMLSRIHQQLYSIQHVFLAIRRTFLIFVETPSSVDYPNNFWVPDSALIVQSSNSLERDSSISEELRHSGEVLVTVLFHFAGHHMLLVLVKLLYYYLYFYTTELPSSLSRTGIDEDQPSGPVNPVA